MAFEFEDFGKKFLVLIVSLVVVYVGYSMDTKTDMSVDNAMEVGGQFTFTLLAVVLSVFFAESLAGEVSKAVEGATKKG